MNSVPAMSWTGPMCDRLRERPGHKRGPLTGPSPTDCGKNGPKIHLITDRNGLPLSSSISGANVHDSLGLETARAGDTAGPLRRGPRRQLPAKLHAENGYDYDHLRRWLRKRGIRRRSPAKASSPRSGWADTAGSSSERCPGRLPPPAPP
jgi:hypothetical protein